jgi:hypothetical protein
MILRARGRAYLVEGVTLEERLGAFAVVDVLDLPVRSHGRAATAAASPAKMQPPPPLKTCTVLQYAHNKRHAERENTGSVQTSRVRSPVFMLDDYAWVRVSCWINTRTSPVDK